MRVRSLRRAISAVSAPRTAQVPGGQQGDAVRGRERVAGEREGAGLEQRAAVVRVGSASHHERAEHDLQDREPSSGDCTLIGEWATRQRFTLGYSRNIFSLHRSG